MRAMPAHQAEVSRISGLPLEPRNFLALIDWSVNEQYTKPLMNFYKGLFTLSQLRPPRRARVNSFFDKTSTLPSYEGWAKPLTSLFYSPLFQEFQNGNRKKGIPGRDAGFALPHELLDLPMSPHQNQVTTTPLPGSSFLLW